MRWLLSEVSSPENRYAAVIQIFFWAKLTDKHGQISARAFPLDIDARNGNRTMGARLTWMEHVIRRIRNGEFPKK
jgi:hypothetical protein